MNVTFHDLRHTGQTLAASTGASLADLKKRLGHASDAAASRYLHAVDGRDKEIAAALSQLAARQRCTTAEIDSGEKLMWVLLEAVSASLAELEARVAALEAERADYRAVIATVNALSQQTRERLDQLEEKIDRVDGRVDRLETKLDDTNACVRSIEESVAEVKDLLIRALDNK